MQLNFLLLLLLTIHVDASATNSTDVSDFSKLSVTEVIFGRNDFEHFLRVVIIIDVVIVAAACYCCLGSFESTQDGEKDEDSFIKEYGIPTEVSLQIGDTLSQIPLSPSLTEYEFDQPKMQKRKLRNLVLERANTSDLDLMVEQMVEGEIELQEVSVKIEVDETIFSGEAKVATLHGSWSGLSESTSKSQGASTTDCTESSRPYNVTSSSSLATPTPQPLNRHKALGTTHSIVSVDGSILE